MSITKVKKIFAASLAAVSALALSACGVSDKNSAETTVKIGLVGAMYEDLWDPAKKILADEGINLEYVQFADYTTPNSALSSGDIDLNAFQHVAYLDSEVQAQGYDIQPVGYTFIIPLNLYSEQITSVQELKDGDKVAIPNDPTNGGRALKVLEAAGVLKLKADAGFSPTDKDIESFTKKIELVPLAANTIQPSLPDVAAGFVNGNFALSAGLDPEKAVYQDKQLSDEEYWNVIVAASESLKDPQKKALYGKVVKAFQSSQTQEVFDTTFKGYFLPVAWDEDLLK